jgi:hypothetical protein
VVALSETYVAASRSKMSTSPEEPLFTEWEAAGRPGKPLEDYIRERGLEIGETEA